MKNKITNQLEIATKLKIKEYKITKIMLLQHAIITNLFKYNKEFTPKIYNENIKKTIKTLMKEIRIAINDLL